MLSTPQPAPGTPQRRCGPKRQRRPPSEQQIPLFSDLDLRPDDDNRPARQPDSAWQNAPSTPMSQSNLHDWDGLSNTQIKIVVTLEATMNQLGVESVAIAQPPLAEQVGCGVRHLSDEMKGLVKIGRVRIVEPGKSKKRPTRYALAFQAAGPRRVDKPGPPTEGVIPLRQTSEPQFRGFNTADPGTDDGRRSKPLNSSSGVSPGTQRGSPYGQSVNSTDLGTGQSGLTDDERSSRPLHSSAGVARPPSPTGNTYASPAEAHAPQRLNPKPTRWKPTADDVRAFAKFIRDQVGQYDEKWAARVLKAATRARSIQEVIDLCRAKASKRSPPRMTGWFMTVAKEHFGPLNSDGSPVDRHSVEQAAIAHFGARTNIPYDWWQLLNESIELAAARLATCPRPRKGDDQ